MLRVEMTHFIRVFQGLELNDGCIDPYFAHPGRIVISTGAEGLRWSQTAARVNWIGSQFCMRRFISFRDFDWVLLGLVMLLSIISIFEIYSATLHTKFVGFETKQIFWLMGGLAAMFIFSLINYHRLLESVHWVYGFCLVSLVGVLLFGTKVLGGRRWIKLPGGIHFQPSEWVKVVLIVAMARYFAGLAGEI